MKDQAKPAAIVAGIIVLAAIVGFFAWHTFGSKGETLSQTSVDAHYQSKKNGPNR